MMSQARKVNALFFNAILHAVLRVTDVHVMKENFASLVLLTFAMTRLTS